LLTSRGGAPRHRDAESKRRCSSAPTPRAAERSARQCAKGRTAICIATAGSPYGSFSNARPFPATVSRLRATASVPAAVARALAAGACSECWRLAARAHMRRWTCETARSSLHSHPPAACWMRRQRRRCRRPRPPSHRRCALHAACAARPAAPGGCPAASSHLGAGRPRVAATR
jgi:hypothetical protein